MQHLEVSCAVRPLKWSLGVQWLRDTTRQVAVRISYALRVVGIGANFVTELSPTLVNFVPTRT